MTPIERIINAYAVFALSLKLWNNCQAAKSVIVPNMFKDPLVIMTGGPGITVEGESLTQELLEDRAYNLMIGALAILSIVVDEAADAIWGKKPALDEKNLNKARIILHQIRNAFAHGPLEPKWHIYEKYQQKIQLSFASGEKITFCADALNGRGFKPSDVGGFEGIITLIKFIVEEAKSSR